MGSLFSGRLYRLLYVVYGIVLFLGLVTALYTIANEGIVVKYINTMYDDGAGFVRVFYHLSNVFTLITIVLWYPSILIIDAPIQYLPRIRRFWIKFVTVLAYYTLAMVHALFNGVAASLLEQVGLSSDLLFAATCGVIMLTVFIVSIGLYSLVKALRGFKEG